MRIIVLLIGCLIISTEFSTKLFAQEQQKRPFPKYGERTESEAGNRNKAPAKYLFRPAQLKPGEVIDHKFEFHLGRSEFFIRGQTQEKIKSRGKFVQTRTLNAKVTILACDKEGKVSKIRVDIAKASVKSKFYQVDNKPLARTFGLPFSAIEFDGYRKLQQKQFVLTLDVPEAADASSQEPRDEAKIEIVNALGKPCESAIKTALLSHFAKYFDLQKTSIGSILPNQEIPLNEEFEIEDSQLKDAVFQFFGKNHSSSYQHCKLKFVKVATVAGERCGVFELRGNYSMSSDPGFCAEFWPIAQVSISLNGRHVISYKCAGNFKLETDMRFGSRLSTYGPLRLNTEMKIHQGG